MTKVLKFRSAGLNKDASKAAKWRRADLRSIEANCPSRLGRPRREPATDDRGMPLTAGASTRSVRAAAPSGADRQGSNNRAIRLDKIDRARTEIASGQCVTSARLEVSLDRMIDAEFTEFYY